MDGILGFAVRRNDDAGGITAKMKGMDGILRFRSVGCGGAYWGGADIMSAMSNCPEMRAKVGGATAEWQRIRVAIDGPAASGKSTVGRAAAQRLGLRFLDTGLMYRAVTWLALRRNVAADDAAAVAALARRYPISIGISSGSGIGGSSDDDAASAAVGLAIGGHTPGDALWDAAVDAAVSAVSAASGVRAELVRQQRAIGQAGGIIMAGRDIGSVVLPDADAKLYITASAEERARRRLAQQRADSDAADTDTDSNAAAATVNPAPDFCQVLADTRRRDALDSGRAHSPLTIADGATVINTDGLNLEQSVAAVLDAIHAAAAISAAAPNPHHDNDKE